MFQYISSAVSNWIASLPEGQCPPLHVWAAVLAYNNAAAINADNQSLKKNKLSVNRRLLKSRWDDVREGGWDN